MPLGPTIARALANLSAGPCAVASEADLDRAARQVAKWSEASMPLSAACGDKGVYFAGNIGHVTYQFSAGAMVILSEPVCKPGHERALLRRVARFARSHAVRPVFFMVSPRWMPLLHDFGLRFFNLGSEAVIDLAAFNLDGPERAYLRRVLRRTEAEGFTFEVHTPPDGARFAGELRSISDAWLAEHGVSEKQFSQSHFCAAALNRLTVATVRTRAGKLAAFVTLLATPAGGCPQVTLDLLRSSRQHVWGLSHFAVARAIMWAKKEGYATFNLSMAPVFRVGGERTSPLIERLARRFSRSARGPFNDAGLRRFKGVYSPRWEPRYMAYHPGVLGPGLWRAFWQTTSLVMAFSDAARARIARSRRGEQGPILAMEPRPVQGSLAARA